MTELLIGTKKGLFVLRGKEGAPFANVARVFAGEPVEYAIRDPRSGRYLAAMTSAFYGPKLMLADDPAGEWREAEGIALPEEGDTALKRIWTIVAGEEDGLVYAGGDPGVLFESRDGGETWTLNRGLWDQPTRPDWSPGGGGLCLHSVVPWPGDPSRIALGISAVGVWLSDDGGRTWRNGNAGLVPRYLPEEARQGSMDLCVHDLHRSPSRPERLFMQFHGGVYRSDDAGESWIDVGTDTELPSDFGFPMLADPDDPDSAYVIPLSADLDRVTPDGHVRVYETRDAGASWIERGDGLPAENAYLTILRQAFDREGAGGSMGLYFGATSGDVFGSGDAGRTWFTAATKLPPVYSVRVA
ncbi:MAG TPA: sialidase family protein [Gaiellaceae bacterium]|nr:sialidase family protein [Gaiellaceae bacterium]